MPMAKKPHILIANNIYPPIMAGGAELIVQYQAEELARRGFEVTVVSTCGPEMEPYAEEHTNGVTILRFFPKNLYWHWTRGDRPSYQKALWHFRDAWNHDAGEKFSKILQERKPDILHTHLIDGLSAIIWKCAQDFGIPVLHTAHDYHLLCPRAVMLTRENKLYDSPSLPVQIYRKWHVGTTRYVDLFCSPSQFLIDKHLECGVKASHSAVVRNGIPLPQIADADKKKSGVTKFLFAARHTAEKGCEVLINSVKAMPKNAEFEMLIAGKGPYEEQFKALSTQDSRVKMLGYISGEEKDKIFKSVDCLLIPSLWYENAPVVIVEAAAYGVGIIGSDLGAIPEFITHEKSGLLFEPGNPQALADALKRVINEPDLKVRFREGGKDLLAQSSVESMVDSYLEKYEDLWERKAIQKEAA